MSRAVQVITPEWLFEQAGLIAAGSGDFWKQDISERGPGTYIVTIDVPPPGGHRVIYIGRSKHLRRRLAEFRRHKYGAKSPHRGGQEILNLSGTKMIHWAPAAEYEKAEELMLDSFRQQTCALPYGNRVKSARRKQISS